MAVQCYKRIFKVNNEKLSVMQVDHEELETKIKEDEEQLIVKREEYLKFNKAGFLIDVPG